MNSFFGVSAFSILGCAIAGYYCLQETTQRQSASASPSGVRQEASQSQLPVSRDATVPNPLVTTEMQRQMVPVTSSDGVVRYVESVRPVNVQKNVPGQTQEVYAAPQKSAIPFPTIQRSNATSLTVQASEVTLATKAYTEADTEEARSKAREQLAKALTSEYEQIMEQHEKQLVEMEQRLKSLREQYEKRVAAKGAMVSMRLESIVSQVDGLGWPTAPPQTRRPAGFQQQYAPDQFEPYVPFPGGGAINRAPVPVPGLQPNNTVID